jgi:anti-repressor protein
MNDLQIFNYGERQVRTVLVDGNPWFVGKDVAEILGYAIPRKAVRDHCKKHHDVGGSKIDPPSNIDPQTLIIPESDVYRLVMRSKLPEAEAFQDWVVEQVLPQIRKTGSYGMDPMKALNDPAAMRGLLLTYCEKVIALEETVNQQKPKIIALDRLSTANGSKCITDAAKVLQVQPKVLFSWMPVNKWIYRRTSGSGWIAYQNRLLQGVLEHKVNTVERPDGSEKASVQVRVTPKGLSVLAEKLSKEDNLFA